MEDDIRIINFLKGNLSEKEKTDFFLWLEESSENKTRYFKEKDLWDTYGRFVHKRHINIQTEWNVISEKLSFVKDKSIIFINNKLQFWLSTAAVILFAFVLGWGSNFILDKSDELYSCQLEVPKGQRSKVLLSDGTEVWLNSDTKLNFSYSNDNERLVDLEGEAYFRVAHNKKKPFIVKVNGQRLKVLGTVFNIRSYANEDKVITTLEEGSVEIIAGGRKLVLIPNQQLEYDRHNKTSLLTSVETDYFTLWTKGRYVFENESLSEIIKMVERWYDVKIVCADEFVKNMRFSGVIKRNLPVEHFFKLINHTTAIKYEIDGDIIYLKNK